MIFRSLLFLLICGQAFSDHVNISVSRKSVRQNESITVVFSSKQKIHAKPDFSPINRDFEILSQNQSSSTRMINGTIDHEMNWTLSLISKREGDVVIPSIRFGNLRTEPVTVHVTEPMQATLGDPIYLEVEVKPDKTLFALSQVICTVRLYRSVNLYNGRLSEVEVSDPDAIIESLGEDREFEQINGGERYVVLERKLAIFPQHVGTLKISPVIFEGQIVKSGRSVFNIQTQYTRLASKEIVLNVKPIPDGFSQQNWLAANDVKLLDEWSTDISKINMGEPVTRTVTVMADGCLASQIPQVSLNIPVGIKQYPDKPQMTNQNGVHGNTGVLQSKAALMVTKPGVYVLPEISLKWWNVKENKMQVTTLPEIELNVLDVLGAVSTKEESSEFQEEFLENSTPKIPIWAWVLMGLNGVWVFSFLLLIKVRKSPFKRKVKRQISTSRGMRKLKNACLKNDAKETEKWFLHWAEGVFSQEKPLNLITIKCFLPENLQEEVEVLNGSLYGKRGSWEGKSFWRAFLEYKPEKARKGKEQEGKLKNLYPSSELV